MSDLQEQQSLSVLTVAYNNTRHYINSICKLTGEKWNGVSKYLAKQGASMQNAISDKLQDVTSSMVESGKNMADGLVSNAASYLGDKLNDAAKNIQPLNQLQQTAELINDIIPNYKDIILESIGDIRIITKQIKYITNEKNGNEMFADIIDTLQNNKIDKILNNILQLLQTLLKNNNTTKLQDLIGTIDDLIILSEKAILVIGKAQQFYKGLELHSTPVTTKFEKLISKNKKLIQNYIKETSQDLYVLNNMRHIKAVKVHLNKLFCNNIVLNSIVANDLRIYYNHPTNWNTILQYAETYTSSQEMKRFLKLNDEEYDDYLIQLGEKITNMQSLIDEKTQILKKFPNEFKIAKQDFELLNQKHEQARKQSDIKEQAMKKQFQKCYSADTDSAFAKAQQYLKLAKFLTSALSNKISIINLQSIIKLVITVALWIFRVSLNMIKYVLKLAIYLITLIIKVVVFPIIILIVNILTKMITAQIMLLIDIICIGYNFLLPMHMIFLLSNSIGKLVTMSSTTRNLIISSTEI